MEKVNIYIDVYHTGHLKKGTGTYGVVLEYITVGGVPKTREYTGGVKRTSLNRTALYSCIASLGHLIRTCEVLVHINSEYIVQAANTGSLNHWLETGINAKGKPAKNLDLWQQLATLMEQHRVAFIFTGSSSYTAYMANLIKKSEIEYKEDEGNV